MSQYNQYESVYPIVLLRTAQVNTQLESRCLHAQSRELSHLTKQNVPVLRTHLCEVM